jgi:hypothetical protein
VIFRLIGVDQQGHIWRMDGDGVKQVTTGAASSYTISRGWKPVCFARSIPRVACGFTRRRRRPAPCQRDGHHQHGQGGGFGPDGKHIGTLEFEKDDKGLIRNVFKIVPTEGGAPIATLRCRRVRRRSPTSAPRHRVCQPDGSALECICNGASAEILGNATEPSLTQLSHFTDGRVTGIVSSPDGKYIAAARRLPVERISG